MSTVDQRAELVRAISDARQVLEEDIRDANRLKREYDKALAKIEKLQAIIEATERELLSEYGEVRP